MTHVPRTEYEGSDERAIAIGEVAYKYIVDEDVEGLPLGFRGVDVYGVIAMLRKTTKLSTGRPRR